MAFPSYNPGEDIGEEHTEGNSTWKWDGEKWQKQFNISANSSSSVVDTEGEVADALVGHTSSLLPDATTIITQKDANTWSTRSLRKIDELYDTNEKFVGGFAYGSTAPSDPTQGTLWYNTSPPEESGLKIYDGSDWKNANGYSIPDKVGSWSWVYDSSRYQNSPSATKFKYNGTDELAIHRYALQNMKHGGGSNVLNYPSGREPFFSIHKWDASNHNWYRIKQGYVSQSRGTGNIIYFKFESEIYTASALESGQTYNISVTGWF